MLFELESRAQLGSTSRGRPTQSTSVGSSLVSPLSSTAAEHLFLLQPPSSSHTSNLTDHGSTLTTSTMSSPLCVPLSTTSSTSASRKKGGCRRTEHLEAGFPSTSRFRTVSSSLRVGTLTRRRGRRRVCIGRSRVEAHWIGATRCILLRSPFSPPGPGSRLLSLFLLLPFIDPRLPAWTASPYELSSSASRGPFLLTASSRRRSRRWTAPS